MIRFHELPEKIVQQLAAIELLYPYHKENIEIYGDTEERKNTKISYYLHKITISDLPKENIWVFEAENTKAKSLSAGSKTVERCILYLQGEQLYLFMIELKSKISDCKKLREKVKDKFECTLERLIIYLASSPIFGKVKDLKIVPVGVLAFNKDEYEISQGGSSLICQSFTRFKQTKNAYQTVKIEPVILGTLIIDFFIFQNPNFADNDTATLDNFNLSFHQFIKE